MNRPRQSADLKNSCGSAFASAARMHISAADRRGHRRGESHASMVIINATTVIWCHCHTCHHTHVTREVNSRTRRGLFTLPAAVDDHDVGGRPALQRTLRATDVTRNWSCLGRLFGVFQSANDCRWDNYRRKALLVQWWAPCWLLSVVCARR